MNRFSVRDIIKSVYFYNIKKMKPHEYRVYHLRKAGMNIGENCWLFSDDLETAEPYLVSIGNNVMISSNVLFTTHDASASYYIKGASDIFGRINIGNNVFIGMGSIVMPGVTIADNCIIGAGSVVTKSFLKPGGVIAGNPATRICSVEDLKNKNSHLLLNVWNCENKKDYLLKNEDKFKVAKQGDL